jgi:hypothetical protein
MPFMFEKKDKEVEERKIVKFFEWAFEKMKWLF